jgi:proteasome accessory factor C
MVSSAREQVARLLALAPYLQAREGGVPLARVAADFGVKPEQIVKDLKVLWMCGLPGLGPGDLVEIDFEAFEDDPDGLVRIGNADYLARPLRLGSSEAAALIVALRALREGGGGAARDVVDRVLAKLEEAASAGVPAPVDVRMPGSGTSAEDERQLATELAAAIERDRQVRLDYYVPTRDETTSRVVDPIAVLTAEGHGYLDAWCHLVEGRRLFRLSRIQGLQLLDEPRQARDVAPRDLSEGLFEAGPEDVPARIHLAPGYRWVADYYPVTAVAEAADGGLDVDLLVGDPRWLVRLVLRLAPGVTVLAPPELATAARRQAEATLALYDSAAGH